MLSPRAPTASVLSCSRIFLAGVGIQISLPAREAVETHVSVERASKNPNPKLIPHSTAKVSFRIKEVCVWGRERIKRGCFFFKGNKSPNSNSE